MEVLDSLNLYVPSAVARKNVSGGDRRIVRWDPPHRAELARIDHVVLGDMVNSRRLHFINLINTGANCPVSFVPPQSPQLVRRLGFALSGIREKWQPHSISGDTPWALRCCFFASSGRGAIPDAPRTAYDGDVCNPLVLAACDCHETRDL
jgi:hypothetical protein